MIDILTIAKHFCALAIFLESWRKKWWPYTVVTKTTKYLSFKCMIILYRSTNATEIIWNNFDTFSEKSGNRKGPLEMITVTYEALPVRAYERC